MIPILSLNVVMGSTRVRHDIEPAAKIQYYTRGSSIFIVMPEVRLSISLEDKN